MKYLSAVYNCFPWAMTIAITCFRSMWLQMRVNTGYIFLGGWLFLTATLCIIFRKKQRAFGLIFTAFNLLICTLYAYVLYGWKRMQVVPASIIREGLHQSTLKFAVINRFILILLVVGIVLIFVKEYLRNEK